ncbi:MAG: 2-C-methyl-D-erythritol 4-phosphate cytidylyltransferase [Kiritimatiellae bacterium]|nr:2-C-methyl-D-erythritol 4-phosphate cytidylyltransferase [Kiritimatiellia bacterium]
MTVAIVLAGGSGRRMGSETPKQFIRVDGKPVIAYTLDNFQRHPEIDAILVVCIAGWADEIRAIASRNGIGKLRWIVDGGTTGQESIRNGVFALEGICGDGDVAVIHDGIRPLVDDFVLSDVIRVCRERGAAATAMPYNEQIFVADDDFSSTRFIPRETIRRVATPQAYRFGLLDRAYHEAFEKGIGIGGSSYANTMMVELGHRIWFAAGSDKNIKLTTPDDLEIFRGYLARNSREPDR